MTNHFIFMATAIGIGGTIALDIRAYLVNKIFGLPATNWAIVGRWIVNMKTGKFINHNLTNSPNIYGELAIGWIVHYLIGIFYGFILLFICGIEWCNSPTILPAMIIAWVSLAAPFLIMMPGMGIGIAGCNTPNQMITIVKSIAAHSMFGDGMFITTLIL